MLSNLPGHVPFRRLQKLISHLNSLLPIKFRSRSWRRLPFGHFLELYEYQCFGSVGVESNTVDSLDSLGLANCLESLPITSVNLLDHAMVSYWSLIRKLLRVLSFLIALNLVLTQDEVAHEAAKKPLMRFIRGTRLKAPIGKVWKRFRLFTALIN